MIAWDPNWARAHLWDYLGGGARMLTNMAESKVGCFKGVPEVIWHTTTCMARHNGEGKRRNEFAEWHEAWLLE